MPNGGGSQLLELTLLSARDLAHVSKSMKSFAVVWIDPARKLETRPDGKNQNNPTWNDKFVFKLDHPGDDSSAAVNVEIYAATSRRSDAVPVGGVSVLVASLFPASDDDPSRPSDLRYDHHRRSRTRYLTLQVRRPSGRPQGVVDVGVAILDATRRSMPLSAAAAGSDLSASVTTTRTSDVNRHNYFKSKLRRSKSERSISEVYLLKPAATETDESSAADGGGGGGGKWGTAAMRGSVSSDVGPSPSVVAAEIAAAAKKKAAAAETESSILEDWVEEDDDSVEGLRTKIERWRSEIHPLYHRGGSGGGNGNNINNNTNDVMAVIRRSTYRRNGSGDMTVAAAATPSKRGHRRGGSSGLFSCFGTAYGCEFSITCGGGGKSGRKNRSSGGGSSDDDVDDEGPISLSELHYGDQYV